MKKLFNVVLLIIATKSVALCQQNLRQIKLINDQVLAINSALIILPKAFVDSTTLAIEPFKEVYYKNRLLDELGKVEKSILNPDVKISYYFFNKSLIKVTTVDKSANYTFNIESYFHDDKLLYVTRKSVDGDNSGKWLIKNAKDYLKRYDLSH